MIITDKHTQQKLGFYYLVTFLDTSGFPRIRFISEFKVRLMDCLHQYWNNALSNYNKAHYYMQFKFLLNVEYYLTINIPFYTRIAFAKFRCSDYKINIEDGRHQRNMGLHYMTLFI